MFFVLCRCWYLFGLLLWWVGVDCWLVCFVYRYCNQVRFCCCVFNCVNVWVGQYRVRISMVVRIYRVVIWFILMYVLWVGFWYVLVSMYSSFSMYRCSRQKNIGVVLILVSGVSICVMVGCLYRCSSNSFIFRVSSRNSSEGGYLVMLNMFISVVLVVFSVCYGLLLQMLIVCSSMKLSRVFLLVSISCCWCCVVLLLCVNYGLIVQFRVIMLIYGSIGQEVCRCRWLFSVIQLCWCSIFYRIVSGLLFVICILFSRLCLVISISVSVVSVLCGSYSSLVRMIMFRLIVQIICRQIMLGGNCRVQVKLIISSFSVIRNRFCLSRNVLVVCWLLVFVLLYSQVDSLVSSMNMGVYRWVSRWLMNSVGLVWFIIIGFGI